MRAFQRSASTAFGLLALLACDQSEPRVDPDSGDSVDTDAGESPPDSGWQRPCEQRGAIAVPWAEGVFPVRYYGDAGPYLTGRPDSLEATTADGQRVACKLFKEDRNYVCENEGGLTTITASLRAQSWSWPAKCPYWEDYVRLHLDGAEPCVEPGTVVVEGDLLNLDSSRPMPTVTLEGPWQEFDSSGDSHFPQDEKADGHVPGIACAVAEGHFRCPTLGFRTTVQHAVVAGGVRTEIALPVSDCAATTVTLDLTCPALPSGFYVEVPVAMTFSHPLHPGNRSWGPQYDVQASYDGGALYPCVPEPEPAYRGAADATYFCPAAGGDEWGRGRYEVVAKHMSSSGDGPAFVGSVTDPFDACGGTPEPLQLQAADRTQ
jgi:hypothetical protein